MDRELLPFIVFPFILGVVAGVVPTGLLFTLDDVDDCSRLESEAVQRDDYEEARYWRDAHPEVCSDVWRHQHGE